MAGGGGAADGASSGISSTRSLEYTPTWAVATVCFMFVIVSLIGERSLHHLGNWLTRTRRKPLAAALEKMKEELMLLGFISLIITVTATYISKICIKSSFYDKQRMPCKLPHKGEQGYDRFLNSERLLFEYHDTPRRILASTAHSCPKDHEPFVSFLGLEQLHRFIFVMAVTHVIYSCLTMLLAIMKVYSWRPWEQEAYAYADNQDNLNELTRDLTLKRQSTFVACHVSNPWSRNKLLLWVICFFRQFGLGVTKSDYLALRMGFIMKHGTDMKYDFHLYMIRCMEDEFKDIIGITPPLWIFVLLFMLLDVNGTNLYFWISFLPIAMVLVVGTKLQHIIATLALENSGLYTLNLKPRNELFWFKRPRVMLHLIHFILFQVGFELATFFWIWWQFGWHSCYMSRRTFAYVRVFTGFLVQVLCSYSTLPLYAIVTQMGSNHKKAIFQKSLGKSKFKDQNDYENARTQAFEAFDKDTEYLNKGRVPSDASIYSSVASIVTANEQHSRNSSIQLGSKQSSLKAGTGYSNNEDAVGNSAEDHSRNSSIQLSKQSSLRAGTGYLNEENAVGNSSEYHSMNSSTQLNKQNSLRAGAGYSNNDEQANLRTSYSTNGRIETGTFS